MRKKLTQPIIRWYRDQLSHNSRFGAYSYVYSEESRVLLDELFGLLEQIKPSGENGARTLWFWAERGPIEDYGDADKLIADGEFENREAFIRLASAQPKNRSAFTPRLASMTAGDFFRFCALGYAANGYPIDGLSPREQYRRFADGRDEGLTDIDERSPEAFYAWLTARHGGGHPWAVSTHISLGVAHDSGGYWLRLTENATSRTMETVRFYLALCRAGMPVFLSEAAALAERLAGTERIGIVPEGVTPVHCERYFPGQHIIAFMNLPEEDRERFAPLCSWQPIDEVFLDI